MTATISPIETTYAGCRFRSRLEARWAVFFDALGIRWEYEAQGYELGWRLDLARLEKGEVIHYLPDFWLPDHRMFAEVKGSWTHDECWRFLNAAAALSENGGGGGCTSGHNTVLLGPVPTPGGYDDRAPVRLHLHKGDLSATPWTGEVPRDSCNRYDREKGYWTEKFPDFLFGPGDVANDAENSLFVPKDELLRGMRLSGPPGRRYQSALRAARSARFEHGESGHRAA